MVLGCLPLDIHGFSTPQLAPLPTWAAPTAGSVETPQGLNHVGTLEMKEAAMPGTGQFPGPWLPKVAELSPELTPFFTPFLQG